MQISNGFRVLAALLHGTLVVGVSQNFAALNRGRHLYSAGRRSRWALANISSSCYFFFVIFLICAVDQAVFSSHGKHLIVSYFCRTRREKLLFVSRRTSATGGHAQSRADGRSHDSALQWRRAVKTALRHILVECANLRDILAKYFSLVC